MKGDRHDYIKRRLDDWGAFRRDTAPGMGWNVHALDFDSEVPRGIQKRNDEHSDPVFTECRLMQRAQRQAMVIDTAVRELRPRVLRRVVVGRHRHWPEISDTGLAEKLDIERRLVAIFLALAYEAITEGVEALERPKAEAC